ncbi:hypothetical protein K505DRAFT_145571 [Melanomma pulvis-pyrius CBS 109.77]|uniref:Secreted protein n=1 Tax=Melanomma pulvis-pyrius CBS 109.77 TaxID=1314802 RepID=A0A6A6WQS9_9PLEO|nr:hypothetical protein K505DRAFT_145571 [Melanomma pulvis-pyrius CBS 109.77]
MLTCTLVLRALQTCLSTRVLRIVPPPPLGHSSERFPGQPFLASTTAAVLCIAFEPRDILSTLKHTMASRPPPSSRTRNISRKNRRLEDKKPLRDRAICTLILHRRLPHISPPNIL